MLQKEVADRLLAPSGTREYGILSVLMDMYTEMERKFDVPPECFFPRPRVWSTVVTFRMRGDAKYPMRNPEALRPIVKCAFAHRRKTLFNNLRQAGWLNFSPETLRQRLLDGGIDPRRRAETLDTQEYARITDILTMKNCA
jgi:16S rRNA (adenine1518-N6/adenine1519-N6)-dimethyltransferase